MAKRYYADNASARTFFAALISRECRMPHLGQTHSPAPNGIRSSPVRICPHLEHVLFGLIHDKDGKDEINTLLGQVEEGKAS